MAEAWKGAVVGQVNHFDGRRELTVLAGEDVPRLLVSDGPKRVVFTPIEDESLPHPGDGKTWIATPDVPVDILSAPTRGFVMVQGGVGRPWVMAVDALRERKPEPEHEEWCDHYVAMSYAGFTDVCTCERRSGEERRKGERRDMSGPSPNYVSRVVREGLLRGRRSGTDRRNP